ncbi:MAG TPA: hypothetical protein VGK48_15535 [Terriglobia bacterium]|jgi:hypothetical protein
MIKQLSALALGLAFIALPLRAQTANTVSVGFAVVTPAAAAATGLTAVETIGNLQGSTIETASLPAASLTTNASVIVDLDIAPGTLTSNTDVTGSLGTGSGIRNLGPRQSLPSGSSQVNGQLPAPATARLTSTGATPVALFSNTAISIVNPHSTTATITATLTDSQGMSISLPALQVPAMQQTSRFVNQFLDTSISLKLPFNGVITFNADMPVGIAAFQFSGSSFSTVPVLTSPGTALIPQFITNAGGPGALLLQQFVSGGGWTTQIAIANLSNTPQTVTVDVFGSDGTLVSTLANQQIAANGVLSLSQ